MKVRVTGDLRVAFCIEVEAESLESAEAYVSSLTARQIANEGNLEGYDTALPEVDGSEEVDD